MTIALHSYFKDLGRNSSEIHIVDDNSKSPVKSVLTLHNGEKILMDTGEQNEDTTTKHKQTTLLQQTTCDVLQKDNLIDDGRDKVDDVGDSTQFVSSISITSESGRAFRHFQVPTAKNTTTSESSENHSPIYTKNVSSTSSPVSPLAR